MHVDLIGYLLGALSAVEQREVEDALANDSQLRKELERLRRSLEPLDSLADDQQPPAGLADRTLQAISRQEDQQPAMVRGLGEQQQEAVNAADPPWSGDAMRSFRITDSVALAMVGLVAITLFMPALANSRYAARRDACQDNFRVLGTLLTDDSIRRGGRFVPVPLSGNRAFAGIYAPQLVDRHLLTTDTPRLLCPGTNWREKMPHWSVPTLEQIDQASEAELRKLQEMAGGSYAYIVGYIDDQGRYQAVKNQSRAHFPILADAPSLHLAGRQSANHAGRGQNILYEDGHVSFVTDLRKCSLDDPIRNRRGDLEYGLDVNDAVLLPSPRPPVMQGSQLPIRFIDE